MRRISLISVHGAVSRSASERLRRILGRRVLSRTSPKLHNREQRSVRLPKESHGIPSIKQRTCQIRR